MTSLIIMASAVRAPTCLCSSSSSTSIKPTILNLSSSSLSFHPKSSRLQLYALFPPLGLGPFSTWSGLRHLGISIKWRSLNLEKKRCKDRVAYASLFGVGAPEALVIGVVALLVFGPKGLAEVARSLGKTLRAFQPTIKELQEVSREFKSTLEKEIGLDDISSSTEPHQTNTTSSSSVSSTQESKIAAEPNGNSSQNRAYTTEELLKISEEQLKASAARQQEQISQPESQLEAQTNPQDGVSSQSGTNTTEENAYVREQELQASTVKETAGGTPSNQQSGIKT
ncbi:Twin-arginine translocation protein TatB-like [Trema orientale]|uniref:Twin-arginine translocation protein TatB-like n=1 Tax=Trema orientale TaxID=63057 RepID=A0A2P5B5W6_TREOI|nr:Twin-arginine translocation protein TatB-like [Trema orientale]